MIIPFKHTVEKCLAFQIIRKDVYALQHVPIYVQTTKYFSPVAPAVYVANYEFLLGDQK